MAMAWRQGKTFVKAYNMVSSTNPGSSSGYSGTVDIEAKGGAYWIGWNLGGTSPYHGIGVVVDNVLSVGWSTKDAKRIGVAAYRDTGGNLDGKWTMTTLDGRIGVEKLSGSPGLNGAYRITEGRLGNMPPYGGEVTIVPNGPVLGFQWKVGSEHTSGVGIKVANVVTAAYGVGDQQALGVIAYEIQGNQLVGKWAAMGGSALGTETLQRR